MDRIFKDKNGRVVIGQWPNRLLLGWLILRMIAVFVDDTAFKNSLIEFSMVVLFAWAYLELVSGVNYFRRLLGFTVVTMLILNHFS